jgi:K+-sensing histidine kinase KdpD
MFSVIALLIRLVMGDILVGFPFITFFPAAVLAALICGYRAGIVAAVAGGLFADYFLIDPLYSFFPTSRSDMIGLVFYAFSITLVIALTHKMSEALASDKESKRAMLALNAGLEAQIAARTSEVRAKEARLRAIFETSYQLQGLLDLEGKLLDANPVALDSISATLDDVIGKPFWETPWFSATPGMAEFVRDAIPAVASGQILRREILIDLPTGRRAFDFSLRPIRDEHG